MSETPVSATSTRPSTAPAQAAGGAVHAAIAQAAQATGVDFQYLLAQARLESSLDPSARAATSSAAGLYQFTNGTWLDTLDRHGAQHGLSWVSDAIDGGKVADAGLRSRIMGLRYDANASALMAAELAADNKAELTGALGREPDAAELYLAHFLGISGATEFLTALDANPDQSAAALLPKAAAANKGIFFANGQARSVGSVMALMRSKVAGAMDGTTAMAWSGPVQWGGDALPPSGTELPQAPDPSWGPLAREFHASLPASQPVRTASMADTLSGMFNSTGQAAPANVRNAYAKLARFGL